MSQDVQDAQFNEWLEVFCQTLAYLSGLTEKAVRSSIRGEEDCFKELFDAGYSPNRAASAWWADEGEA